MKHKLIPLDQLTNTIDTAVTFPGRPRSFFEGTKHRLPISCTLYVHRDLCAALEFTARSLRAGCGVKCIFDSDFELQQALVAAPRMSVTWNGANSDEDYETVLVQDSMDFEYGLSGNYSIIDSWRQVHDMLLAGHNVTVDLSLLRKAGLPNSGGTASGPESFAEIYFALYEYMKQPSMQSLLFLHGKLNDVILRGGYKRGIVTSMMDIGCSLIHDYISVRTADLPGSHKKGFIIDEELMSNPLLLGRVIDSVNNESAFLQKRQSNGTFSNVCVGIFLRDCATCLIVRINAGRCSTEKELIAAFEQATREVISLHYQWRLHAPQLYVDLYEAVLNDNQVAIDVMGLANFLDLQGVSYQQFAADLHELVHYSRCKLDRDVLPVWFARAYEASKELADAMCAELTLPLLDRLHTVEPAQAHSFETIDAAGRTTARGIWPPLGSVVNRGSSHLQAVTVDHGDIEVVTSMTPQQIFSFNADWQLLMTQYGKPHAISMDIYEYISEDWMQRWFDSSLQTVYYQFAARYDQSYARKRVAEVDTSDWGCSVCAE
jgi:hypothetical protein